MSRRDWYQNEAESLSFNFAKTRNPGRRGGRAARAAICLRKSLRPALVGPGRPKAPLRASSRAGLQLFPSANLRRRARPKRFKPHKKLSPKSCLSLRGPFADLRGGEHDAGERRILTEAKKKFISTFFRLRARVQDCKKASVWRKGGWVPNF